MSRKTRIKLQTIATRKQKDINMLKDFDANNISSERNKRGEVFVYGTFKGDKGLIDFAQFVTENSLKYEQV
jgi:hypothetical protein